MPYSIDIAFLKKLSEMTPDTEITGTPKRNEYVVVKWKRKGNRRM